MPPQVIADIAERDWPGNVRELRNAADRFVLGLGLSPTEQPAGDGRRLHRGLPTASPNSSADHRRRAGGAAAAA